MNTGDLPEFLRQLTRIHRLCGRRAPSESEAKFWIDELRDFTFPTIVDVLKQWERHSEDKDPPTLKQIKRAVAAKDAAHARIHGLPLPDERSHAGAAAFAAMLKATDRNPHEFVLWARVRLDDPHTPPEWLPFVRAVAALPDRPRRSPVPDRVGAFRRPLCATFEEAAIA